MAHLPPDGMKPIATAPKDGSPVILWKEKVGLYSAQWNGTDWVVRHTREGRTVRLGNIILTDENTLWMPDPRS
jgi:hypothetical protein